MWNYRGNTSYFGVYTRSICPKMGGGKRTLVFAYLNHGNMSLVNAVKNNTPPSYGLYQARLDQELSLAIQQSSKTGQPVILR